jgi:spore germination protein YaaH
MIGNFLKVFSRFFFFLLALLSVFFSADNVYAESSATSTSQTRPYVRLFYYREGKTALASLIKNYQSIDILAPQIYSLDGNGTLVGKINPVVLEFTKSHNIEVVPLVTNKAFNQDHAHNFLNDEALQKKAIDSFVAEAKKYGYSGWQIDFEQMDVSYRDKFSAFIKSMATDFRQNNLGISVAVIAQKSENPADYPKDLWKKLIGVYDYTALGKSADFISVMSYDDPESKGPVARYAWMKEVLAHTLTLVPAEKISLGLPLYYWVWNETTGKLVDIGGYEGILKAYKKHYITKKYSLEEGIPYLTWSGYGSRYKLWYDNGESIPKKLDLVTENHLHGFSAWALGQEVPTVHTAFQKMNVATVLQVTRE